MARSPLLTIDEIEERFDGEWVLVGDPISDKSLNLRGGRVLSHGKDRAKVYRQAIRLRPRKIAMLYTGALETGTAIVL
jgi:hypothetical protein